MEHSAHHMADISSYSSFFILGLLTSLHCVGMCGPIAMLFTSEGKSNVIQSIQYNTFRLISYVCIGSLLFTLGENILTPEFKKISAFILIIFILINSLFKLVPTPVLFKKGLIQLQSRVLKVFPNQFKSIGLGLFSGVFPCGMLYAAYAAALTSNNLKTAALSLSVFAMGTIPLLLSVNIVGLKVFKSLPSKVQKYIYHGLALVSLSFIIIMNFMHHHGAAHVHHH